MRTFIILKTDILNILRDRSLVMILFVPFLILAILRIAPPWYEPLLPVLFEYRPVILSLFCLICSSLAGFLMAFTLLDEKDMQLYSVFRVMPMPFTQLIGLRILLITLLGFIFSLILILGSQLIPISILQAAAYSLASAIVGSIATLLIVSLAHNKIEGVTYFKLFNLLLALPVAGLFVAEPYSQLFGIIPFYWIYKAFVSTAQPSLSLLCSGIGILYNLGCLLLCFRLFRSRIS